MSFSALRKEINHELELFLNNLISEADDDFLRFTYSAVRDYVMAGGKRIRPAMLIMAYRAVGGTSRDIVKAALSVELFHNSTLIHDDIMDEDELRRGNDTVHKVMRAYFLKNNKELDSGGLLFNGLSSRFAASNAICDGNLLFALGIRCLIDSGFDSSLVSEAIKVYSDAYKVVNEGQILDNLFELKNVSEVQYVDMVEKKTAALFSAAVKIGAILGNADDGQIKGLVAFAKSFGIAFQIKDDLDDFSFKKGHEIGSDVRKGKKTLLVIKGLEKDKERMAEFLGKDDVSIESIKSFFEENGITDYANDLAQQKIVEAKGYLRKTDLDVAFFHDLLK